MPPLPKYRSSQNRRYHPYRCPTHGRGAEGHPMGDVHLLVQQPTAANWRVVAAFVQMMYVCRRTYFALLAVVEYLRAREAKAE
ncbi:hypothetical protein K466DRAFT_600789 [Polyporus arcularius HHB13444]|uniref:Uncharacterized protein n=1 Tax=Polyporus arcularius HHB13444 TaxID=1314778 RepID=A0A5C3PB90_9APHY|nr:hypothetical protein K466DRAFT_600789 [Polyporus arcularius HHB13444]